VHHSRYSLLAASNIDYRLDSAAKMMKRSNNVNPSMMAKKKALSGMPGSEKWLMTRFHSYSS
jgi:hypothetical protein